MAELDEVLSDPAALQDALSALDEDDHAERFALLRQQDLLRERASRYAGDLDMARPIPEIRAEIDAILRSSTSTSSV